MAPPGPSGASVPKSNTSQPNQGLNLHGMQFLVVFFWILLNWKLESMKFRKVTFYDRFFWITKMEAEKKGDLQKEYCKWSSFEKPGVHFEAPCSLVFAVGHGLSKRMIADDSYSKRGTFVKGHDKPIDGISASYFPARQRFLPMQLIVAFESCKSLQVTELTCLATHWTGEGMGKSHVWTDLIA